MKNFVNIVNFVRSYDKRENLDLVKPVEGELEIMRKHNLPGTFLLQYDAAISEPYMSMMKENTDLCEIGLWFEVVQPLVEAIGLEWKGRFPVWDWYCNVGSPMGYPTDVREKLIDECMNKFREIYGAYPKSVGAWQMDAFSMRYFSEKYGVKACCICRDQLETDFYTLGGGYYNQAYYPSVNNMLCPAAGKETQINMPVFRMLGNDAIYAYDFKNRGYGIVNSVPTLELCGTGSNEKWVNWFFSETFGGNGLSFQYAQAGQENSMGWHRIGKGFAYQAELMSKLRAEGKIEVKTLCECGEWYLENFDITPASTMTALSDWQEEDRKSVWYSSRYYRANLFWEKGKAFFRDIYLFDDSFKEKYLESVCEAPDCENRNLPVFDGVIYGRNTIIPGIYMRSGDEDIVFDDFEYREENGLAFAKLIKGENYVLVKFTDAALEIETNIENLVMHPLYDRARVYGEYKGELEPFDITYITAANAGEKELSFIFDGKKYKVVAETGHFNPDFSATPEKGKLVVKFDKRG